MCVHAPAAPHLVLFEPLLQQLLASLLQHGPAQLQGLKLVELALVQQDAKVLEEGGRLARLGRNTLEPPDGVRCAEDTLVGRGMGRERESREQERVGG